MTCVNCMKYKPPKISHNGRFKCQECGQYFRLAEVGPGNYWEEDVMQPECNHIVIGVTNLSIVS